MKTSFITLFALVFLSYAHHSAVNKNGEKYIIIHATKDYSGAEVHFEAKESTAEAKKEVVAQMMISLYSSETFVAKDCEVFIEVDYPKIKVDPSETPTNPTNREIDYTTFTAKGYEATTNVELDPEFWELKQKLVVATQCPNSVVFPGNYLKNDGMIGLGFKGDASKNFVGSSKSFAIDYKRTEASKSVTTYEKRLYFNPNLDEKVKGRPLYSVKTDENWRVQGKLGIGAGDNKVAGVDGAVILDINYDYIALPLELYNHAISLLEAKGVKASNPEKTSFTFEGKPEEFANFPNIDITAGDNKITLTPKHYIREVVYEGTIPMSNKGITLKPINPKDRDNYGREVSEKYETGFVVLGQDFLRRHYTVFNRETKEITFFDRKDVDELPADTKPAALTDDTTTPGNGHIYLYIGLIVLAILLIAVGVWWFKRSKDANALNNQYQTAGTDSMVNVAYGKH